MATWLIVTLVIVGVIVLACGGGYFWLDRSLTKAFENIDFRFDTGVC